MSRRKLVAGIATAAIATVGVTVSGVASADDAQDKLGAPTIRMIIDGGPQFDGPSTIGVGQNLRIVNETNPEDIGPHFFTIANKGDIPSTRKEFRQCYKLKKKMCERLIDEHKVNLENFKVKKQLVKNGDPGWDKQFADQSNGDSWYTEQENEEVTQVVSAKAGKRLTYFCVIHPGMKDSIKVLAP